MTDSLRSCELFYMVHLISLTTKYTIQYVQDELKIVTVIDYRQRRIIFTHTAVWNLE